MLVGAYCYYQLCGRCMSILHEVFLSTLCQATPTSVQCHVFAQTPCTTHKVSRIDTYTPHTPKPPRRFHKRSQLVPQPRHPESLLRRDDPRPNRVRRVPERVRDGLPDGFAEAGECSPAIDEHQISNIMSICT
jgi:hypothetical protein